MVNTNTENQEDIRDKISRYFAELNLETGRNQRYHDHKETMAWLAFVYFITALVFFLINTDQIIQIFASFGSVWKCILLSLFPFLFFTALLFIIFQFIGKKRAAMRITEIEQLRKTLITNPDLFLSQIKNNKNRNDEKNNNNEQNKNNNNRTMIQVIDDIIDSKKKSKIKIIEKIKKILKSIQSNFIVYIVMFIIFAFTYGHFIINLKDVHVESNSAEFILINKNQYNDLEVILMEIMNSLEKYNISQSQKKELEHEIRTLDAQISSPRPKLEIINISINSILQIIENGIQNEPTTKLLNKIKLLNSGK